MQISVIVAAADNNVIGNNNTLPWHLPADLQHFKQLTTGHPIIMGRKTYQSIGRPLPHRHNIIITNDVSFSADGCTVVHSLEQALQAAQSTAPPPSEIFIIGGASIYELALPLASTFYLTRVHAQPLGDTFFSFQPDEWEVISTETHTADERNEFDYDFVTLKRI